MRLRVGIALAVCIGAASWRVFAGDVTYVGDVAPILYRSCVECHQPNSIAPMSLLTYAEVRPWAKSIRREVVARKMPPFHAAGPMGYYQDDTRLSPGDIDVIARWVDSGARVGSGEPQLPPVKGPIPEWPRGKPDIVVDLPAFSTTGGVGDDRVNLYSDYVFPEDTWIRGTYLHREPDSRLHHASLFLTSPGEEIPEGRISRDNINVLAHQPLYTWFPGLTLRLLPEGQGVLISKGARLAARAHTAPMNEAWTEKLSIGVYLANGIIDTSPLRLGVNVTQIRLAPGDPNYVLRATRELPVDGLITHFSTHMHLRGKSCQIVLHYPNGLSETVFDLPQYDFDWQRQYYLATPKEAPKGTIVEYVGVMDNSAGNPNNPNPSQGVHWGPNTSDEMFSAIIFYTPKFKMPRTLVVENGHVVSSIENPGDRPAVLWGTILSDRSSGSPSGLNPHAGLAE